MRIATPNGVIYVNCVSNFGKESVFTRGCGLGDHPSRLSNSHQESKAHRDAQILKTSGREVNVLKLLQSRKLIEKKLNQEVLTKLIRCANFMNRKRWALSENFAEFVQFVASLGVEDLSIHLQSAPKNATYLSSFLSVIL